MTKPIVGGEKELPITTVVRFNHEQHIIWYWLMYINQLLNAFFAGGGEFAINLYLYFIIICIEFVMNLLGQRLMSLGNEKARELSHAQHVKDHKKIVELVRYHIEIGT